MSENGEMRTFRFGLFEVEENTGELRKDGKVQPRLRDQAMRILIMLLERPSELVAREELRQRLWSADTFVDFDHGLNTAINQLRGALGDEAANPRFIQTMPRRGYRFIAPVETAGAEIIGPKTAALKTDPGSTTAEPNNDLQPDIARSRVFSDPRDLPAVSGSASRTLFVLIQLVYLTFYVFSLARLAEVRAILTATGDPARLVLVLLIVTAAAGIPIRLYLISASAFRYARLGAKFMKLFPFLLPLDEL